MNFLRKLKAKAAAQRISDEAIFGQVASEIQQGQKRDGLWAKALTLANMDESKARPIYIKLRVQSIKDELTLTSTDSTAAHTTPLKTASPSQEYARPATIAGDFIQGFKDGHESDRPTKKANKFWLYILLAAALIMASFVFPLQFLRNGFAWGDVGGFLFWIAAGAYAYHGIQR